MKRTLTSLLVTGLVLASSVVSFAASASSPAEIYANLTGKTLEEAYELRGTDKTFGQLAGEAEVLDEFKAAVLKGKKEILADKVAKEEITQEQADELIKLMEASCDGRGTQSLGQKAGISFGKGLGRGAGNRMGRGFGQGSGIGQGRGNGLGRNR